MRRARSCRAPKPSAISGYRQRKNLLLLPPVHRTLWSPAIASRAFDKGSVSRVFDGPLTMGIAGGLSRREYFLRRILCIPVVRRTAPPTIPPPTHCPTIYIY